MFDKFDDNYFRNLIFDILLVYSESVSIVSYSNHQGRYSSQIYGMRVLVGITNILKYFFEAVRKLYEQNHLVHFVLYSSTDHHYYKYIQSIIHLPRMYK